VDEDGNVFFEPLINLIEVDLDKVLQWCTVEDEDSLGVLRPYRELAEMDCFFRALYSRRLSERCV